MKKIIFISLLTAGIGVSAFAKDKGDEHINTLTVSRFHIDFPAASEVSWTRDASFDKVTFQQQGLTLTAYYDFDNELMGVMQHVDEAVLSEQTLKKIEKEYKAYSITKVLKYEDNQDNSNDLSYFYEPIHDPLSYFVEMTSEKHTIILQVSPEGYISFFKQLQ